MKQILLFEWFTWSELYLSMKYTARQLKVCMIWGGTDDGKGQMSVWVEYVTEVSRIHWCLLVLTEADRFLYIVVRLVCAACVFLSCCD